MTYDVIARARRRRNRFLAVCLTAAAVAGSTVTAVIILAAGTPSLRTTDEAAPPPVTATTAAVVSPAAGDAGGGALPDDLVWNELAGIAVPVSARSGPHDDAAGLARGFTHDAGGAVLAAVHIVVRANPQVGSAIFDPTLRDQVVGPGATPMREQVAQVYTQMREQAGAADGEPLGSLAATLRGYQLTGYRPDTAVVRLLTEASGPTGELVQAVSQVQMVWTGEDWALQAPLSGRFEETMSAASPADVAAFQPFSPGR
ncbi:hypothetical protein ACTI_37850 [Actinoplanes sp. OR16]|uniref:hypothetical protein n=1 Tax=Actinoplanes sp. OR16 TaxID=946334 RepID=UPI000F6EF81D|nr:hypothetical protein [Actinoplanes sp. OR16]BBH67100.1 hypothetical protein ACTI_37850 [Actinoplanes sp. OR16]